MMENISKNDSKIEILGFSSDCFDSKLSGDFWAEIYRTSFALLRNQLERIEATREKGVEEILKKAALIEGRLDKNIERVKEFQDKIDNFSAEIRKDTDAIRERMASNDREVSSSVLQPKFKKSLFNEICSLFRYLACLPYQIILSTRKFLMVGFF